LNYEGKLPTYFINDADKSFHLQPLSILIFITKGKYQYWFYACEKPVKIRHEWRQLPGCIGGRSD
jgi:hypothetical protein